MYNRGSFNKQRYNLLLGQENEVSIREAMVEVVDSLLSHGEDIHELSYCIEQVSGKAFAANATMYSDSLEEELRCSFAAYPNHILSLSCAEAVDCRVSASEDCYDPNSYEENIEGKVNIGCDLWFSEDYSFALAGVAFCSTDFYCPESAIYELIYSTVGSLVFEYKYINIDATIPPGGTLIIDSDNYVVLLNSENAIDKQSGDWLDELTRNTFDITIGSGVKGSLEGAILYTERYL